MNDLVQEINRPKVKTNDLPVLQQFRTSSLCDQDVYNHRDEKLGQLHDLVVELPAGLVSFVIMSSGGFWGIGEKLLAIPWKALTRDTHRKRFVLDISLDRLKSAPDFDSGNWPDLNDPAWASDIYGYYGVGHPRPQKAVRHGPGKAQQ